MSARIIDFRQPISEARKGFLFRVGFTSCHDSEGRTVRLPCIVMYEESTGIPAAYPRLERWYIDTDASLSANSTLAKRAYCVCNFMNFLLRETTSSYIHETTPAILKDFVRDYKKTKGDKPRDPSEWARGISIVYGFLHNYYEANKDSLPFKYSKKDLYKADDSFHAQKSGQSDNGSCNRESGPPCKVYGVSAPEKGSKKYRYLPKEYLPLLLLTAQKYDPMLTLPIALESYAGLREGEVVNISCGSIQTTYGGFGRISRISVNVTQQAPFALKWDGETDFGSLKVPRKQCVYDAFIEEVYELVKNHMSILASTGAASDKDAPLFLNSYGHPLSVSAYCQRVKDLFYDHFLPALEKACMEEGSWAQNAPFIENYEKNFPGCHAFRHFFTMYLLTVAKLPPEEVAKWRGDNSLLSMYDYIHQNQELIDLFRGTVFGVQRSVFMRALSDEDTD